MALQYVESRRGRRGHPVSPDRIGRMLDIIEVINEQTIAITARHLFYLLTMRPDTRRPIPKTDQAYDRVLIDLLALRRSGERATAVADEDLLDRLAVWLAEVSAEAALEVLPRTRPGR